MRKQDSGPDEPSFEESATVVGAGRGGNTPYATLTANGAATAGIEIGDEVEIKVYTDRIVIHSADE